MKIKEYQLNFEKLKLAEKTLSCKHNSYCHFTQSTYNIQRDPCCYMMFSQRKGAEETFPPSAETPATLPNSSWLHGIPPSCTWSQCLQN